MSPKYTNTKIAGLVLYFTRRCIVECFHAHAAKSMGDVGGAAKFFVSEDGSTKVMDKGRLTPKQIREVQRYIKTNHVDMFKFWKEEDGKPEYFGSVPKMTLE